jgi:hypothetical protein
MKAIYLGLKRTFSSPDLKDQKKKNPVDSPTDDLIRRMTMNTNKQLSKLPERSASIKKWLGSMFSKKTTSNITTFKIEKNNPKWVGVYETKTIRVVNADSTEGTVKLESPRAQPESPQKFPPMMATSFRNADTGTLIQRPLHLIYINDGMSAENETKRTLRVTNPDPINSDEKENDITPCEKMQPPQIMRTTATMMTNQEQLNTPLGLALESSRTQNNVIALNFAHPEHSTRSHMQSSLNKKHMIYIKDVHQNIHAQHFNQSLTPRSHHRQMLVNRMPPSSTLDVKIEHYKLETLKRKLSSIATEKKNFRF